MSYEIDFLAVGEHSKSGDAIVARWGQLDGPRHDQTVIVVDGGFKDTGNEIRDHLDDYYGTNHIDVMVSTHPDDDHIRGLLTLMEDDDVTVGELWIHQPWNYSQQAKAAKIYASRADAEPGSFEGYVANARDLHDLAVAKGVTIVEPLAGHQRTSHNGEIFVAGPSRDYYESLVPDFGSVMHATAIKSLRAAIGALLSRVKESLHIETLTDAGTTSAANNSSVICMLVVDGGHILLTGDAGMPALDAAMTWIDMRRHGEPLKFVQVPHHGSRHNVGPTVLDDLLGHKGTNAVLGTAYCSSAKENPEHKRPAKMVTNAFRRRGYPVYVTAGRRLHHHHNAPDRGWGPASPEPLHDEVEDLDQ